MKQHAAWMLVLLSSCLLAGCRGRSVEEIAPPEGTVWDDLPPVEPADEDWPWWRGPTWDGKAAAGQDPPVRWSKTENVIWKVDVPGRGHGSPCIWGDRIFLPTADEEAEIQYLLCYDRQDGQRLWQTEVHRGGFMHSHEKNSHASSTPACDGQRVFIPFMVHDGIWLTTLDPDGRILWQEKLGRFKTVHGYAASPVLYKSLVIVVADNPGGSFLVARHRKTGKIIWQVRRISYQSFASPIVAHVAGRDQLLVTGPEEVTSYDPSSGRRLWHCNGPTDVAASTIVWGRDTVFASAGYPAKRLLCIRADGSGDVTHTHVVWRKKKDAAYVPSLLLHEGLLYMVNDRGLVQCFEVENGEPVWTERLPGDFSSSPVLAGGNIYVVDEAGWTYVFKSGRKFQLVAENDLGNGGFATPVFCASRIYLRTLHHLYCLGKPGS